MNHLAYTYRSRPFSAEIVRDERNKNTLRFSALPYVRHFLNTECKPGEKVSVIITNKRPKRTDQQNRYYWGAYLPLIADQTGEEIDSLHELFKGMFLTKTIAEVLGKKVRLTQSTTDLSVSGFINYITEIEQFTGIQAPPTENYDLAPLQPLTPVRHEKVHA